MHLLRSAADLRRVWRSVKHVTQFFKFQEQIFMPPSFLQGSDEPLRQLHAVICISKVRNKFYGAADVIIGVLWPCQAAAWIWLKQDAAKSDFWAQLPYMTAPFSTSSPDITDRISYILQGRSVLKWLRAPYWGLTEGSAMTSKAFPKANWSVQASRSNIFAAHFSPEPCWSALLMSTFLVGSETSLLVPLVRNRGKHTDKMKGFSHFGETDIYSSYVPL